MRLDAETIEALGMGDHWHQLALRFGLYAVVSTRRDWRKGRSGSRQAPVAALTTAQRREVSRRAGRGESAAAIACAVKAHPHTVRHYLRARAAA